MRRRLAATLVTTVLVVSACGGADTGTGAESSAASGNEQGATSADGAPTTNLRGSCVAEYDLQLDYFPDEVSFDYAEPVQVSYESNYKLLTYQDPTGKYSPQTIVAV